MRVLYCLLKIFSRIEWIFVSPCSELLIFIIPARGILNFQSQGCAVKGESELAVSFGTLCGVILSPWSRFPSSHGTWCLLWPLVTLVDCVSIILAMGKEIQETDRSVPTTDIDEGKVPLRQSPEAMVPLAGRGEQRAQNVAHVELHLTDKVSLAGSGESKVGSSGSSDDSRTLGEEDTYSVSESGVKQDSSQHPPARVEAKAPWVDLFRKNRQTDQGFNLQTIKEQPSDIIVEAHEMDDVVKAWGHCLVGYFAGKFPGKSALVKVCASWGVRYSYVPHHNGWLVFRFENPQDRDNVLKKGPYFVFGRPLLLKVMPEDFEFEEKRNSELPVWINLPKLPLTCWNPAILSKIASKVGKAVATDRLTVTKEKIAYARVLVEVDASKELVREVRMRMPSGKIWHQEVIYEMEPKYCIGCRTFGHSVKSCKVQPAVHDNHAVEKKGQDGTQVNKELNIPDAPVVSGCKAGQVNTDNGLASEKREDVGPNVPVVQEKTQDERGDARKGLNGEQEGDKEKAIPGSPAKESPGKESPVKERLIQKAPEQSVSKKKKNVAKPKVLASKEGASKGGSKRKPQEDAKKKKNQTDALVGSNTNSVLKEGSQALHSET